ncbi:MAG: hypothetical protein QNJ38_24210, partial [Prochloraceae cyanobacterium]|nr:hypothetical protein [Prochloraceae cyanobacterium]
MTKWIRLNGRTVDTTCDICKNLLRNDCRKKELIHCRDLSVNPIDWIFRGYDKKGFAMWQHKDDAAAWSNLKAEERRKRWLEERDRIKRQKQKQKEFALSIEERDRIIREIIDQLDLSPSDRAKLKRDRHLSDHQIDLKGYRSLKQWQKLSKAVDDRLAGVKLGGRSLLNFAKGIFCPIQNSHGLYVGFQWRPDNPIPGKGKYLWPAGESKRDPRPSSNLANGELPLSVNYPERYSDLYLIEGAIGFCDSVAFKGHTAANFLGIPMVGASGGHFATSSETLRIELQNLKAKEIILYPDAGDIQNPLMMTAINKAIELLHQWGYPVKIAWWNQVEKSVGDIDEIDQDKLKEIEYLSWNEFIAKGNQEIRSTLRLKAVIASSIAEQKRLEGIARRKSKNNNEPEKITSKNGIKLYNTHRLTYKIDHLIHDKRLPNLLPLLPKNGILNLKSAKGSGKSHQIRGTIGSAREEGRKVISITPRIGLGREQAVNWSINWIDDNGYTYWVEIEEELTVESHRQKGLFDKDKITFKKVRVTKKVEKKTKRVEEAEAIGVCWDSLHKLFNSSWSDILVIVDEAESGVKHLLTSSTLKGKRSMILAGLEEKLAETLASEDGMVLLADADLSDISVDYFKSFYPETKITTIVNTHKAPSPWNVELYISEKAKDKVYGKLVKLIAKGKRIAIPVDSQKEGRALEIKLKKIFPKKKIKVVDRLYTQTKDGKEFVENINAKLIEEQLDILIYTPSISMGVSIDEKAFDWVVGFYYGVLEPSEIRQSLARYRPAAPRLVWCNPRGLFPDSCTLTNAKAIGSYIFKYNKEALEQLARYKKQKELNRDPDDDELLAALGEMRDFENKEWRDIHLKTYCRIIARRNYSFYNLAALLEHQLKEEGHRVTLKNSEEKNGIGESIRDIKKELNDAYIHKFTTAKAISMM